MLLIPKLACVYWTGQRCNACVGIIWLARRHKNHHLAFVARNDEPFRIRYDLLDVEAVAWRISKHLFEFAGWVAKDYLTLVCAHENLTLSEPAMRCVVLGEVIVFLLGDLAHLI